MFDYLSLIPLIIRLLQTVYCLLISNSICPDGQSHKRKTTLYGFVLVYLCPPFSISIYIDFWGRSAI